jgi:hypothetical protein
MDSNFLFRAEISSGFEASAELRPIDLRRGGIIRAVVAELNFESIPLRRRVGCEPAFAQLR